MTKSYLVYPPSSSENREEFSYDKNGNFTNVKFYHDYFYDDTILDINYQYFAGSNKLSGISGDTVNSFTYDANGNLKSDALDTTSFFYTRFNHLSRIEMRADGEITPQDSLEYRYSPDGQRVYKNLIYQYETSCGEPGEPGFRGLKRGAERSADSGSVDFGLRDEERCLVTDSTVTRYYNALGMVLMESDGRWVSRKNYIYAGDDKIAVVNVAANATFYYLKDHLGSTRLLVRDSGTVYDKYFEYKAYGDMVREEVNWNQHYKFTGKPFDIERGVNLYYFGARYYDPALGHWLSPDPMAGKYPSLSPYAYCAGNPLKYFDSKGDSLTTFTAKGFESGETPQERKYYIDTKIADKAKGFVQEATAQFDILSVNNAFRTEPSSQLKTSNTKAKGTSLHQAGFAIDLNKVGNLSPSQLKTLNSIASKYGFLPLKNQAKDKPHFGIDPTKFGYRSIDEAAEENQAQYKILKYEEEKKESEK